MGFFQNNSYDPYFEIALINIADYNCKLERATAVKKPLSSGVRFC